MLRSVNVSAATRSFAVVGAIVSSMTCSSFVRADEALVAPTPPEVATDAIAVNDFRFDVPENASRGTVVGRLALENGVHFAIVGGDDEGAFAVDHRTGEITVRRPETLDHESRPDFNLTVDVTTSGSADDEASWRFLAKLLERKRDLAAVLEHRTLRVAVRVTDVNEPPVVETERIDVISNAAEDVVGRLSVRDAEDGEPREIRLLGDVPFRVDATGIIRWNTTHRPQGLVDRSYELVVEAVDSAGATGRGRVAVVVRPSPRDVAATVAAIDQASDSAATVWERGLHWFSATRKGSRRGASTGRHGDPQNDAVQVVPLVREGDGGGPSGGTSMVQRHGGGSPLGVGTSSDARGTSASAGSSESRAGWAMFLIACSGCSLGYLATTFVSRRRLRSATSDLREQMSLLIDETECCRTRTSEAETSRDDALRESQRLQEEGKRLQAEARRLQSQQTALAEEVATLGEALAQSRRSATVVSGTATSTERLSPRSPLDDHSSYEGEDFLVEEPEFDSLGDDSDDELAEGAEYDFATATEPVGVDSEELDEIDPFDIVQTEVLDSEDEEVVYDETDTVTVERPYESEPTGSLEGTQLRRYLAAQFELNDAATADVDDSRLTSAAQTVETPAVGTKDPLASLADRLEALAAKGENPQFGTFDTVESFDDADEPEFGESTGVPPRAESTSSRPDAAAPKPRASEEEESDKYSSVEAYMSRLLGKPVEGSPKKEDTLNDRQAQRLAAITETDGATTRERRRRDRRVDEHGNETEGSTGPVHAVDKVDEREKMQSMRTVANNATNQALDKFRRKFRVRQYKLLVVLAGLVAAAVGLGWFLVT